MAGFGEKRSSKKGKSFLKDSNLSPNHIKAVAVDYHMKGNLEAAEKGYQEFVNMGIEDPDVLSNYGLICQSTLRYKKALKLYEKCIELFPDHSFTCINLGYLYLQLGELEKAENITRKAISLGESLSTAYSLLGVILKEKGEFEEAELITVKAIDIEPGNPDPYINLGLILKHTGHLDKALQVTNKAIKIENNSAIAYLNLGTILQDKGELEEAKINTKQALIIDPKIADGNINLAVILKELGKADEALVYARKEIELYPKKEACYIFLSSLLKECDISLIPTNQIREILILLLKRVDISHRELFPVINQLIPEKLLSEILNSQENIIPSNQFTTIASDQILTCALKLMTFNTFTWEQALTKIRKDLLMNTSKIKRSFKNKLISFTISLGEQCFLNEYIFNQTKKELEAVNRLKEFCANEMSDEFSIALLSCYIPLYKLVGEIDSLKNYKSKNNSFKELIKLQIENPKSEILAKTNLKSIGNIKDKISKEVRNQYENNPYPRWRYTSHINTNKLSLSPSINNEIRPNNILINDLKRKLKVLIAGCGTGQQILDANRYGNAEITAIDLSNSSLAYAQRKIKEYGMENVQFIQLDILDLDYLNEKFDIIECCGVLHHMRDPLAGLSSLIRHLSKEGFIKLGLYSELARRDIVQARKIISEDNIPSTEDGIRLFRERVFNGEYPQLVSLYHWSDFFSTSMCKDLCFHIQEHRYTINNIKSLLNLFDLEFLGFVLSNSIKKHYSFTFSEDIKQINLDNWIQFEESHQDTFRDMYQFWLRANN